MSVTGKKDSWGIESGGTEQFFQMREEILGILKNGENTFVGQDMLIDLKKREEKLKEEGQIYTFTEHRKELYGFFTKWLEKWNEFPKYKYIINYLFVNFPAVSGRVEQHKDILFLELEQMEQGKRSSLSEDAGKCLDLIADSLMQVFREARPSEEDLTYYTKEWVKEGIICPTEEFVFDFLGPVLEMPNEEVDIFLMRVLRRDRLDMFVEKEFLLYVALECDFLESKFNAYKGLKEFYKTLPVPEEREKAGTQYLFESLKKQLERLSFRAMSDVNGSFTDELVEILKWRKGFADQEIRSGQKTFDQLLNDLCAEYGREVESYEKHLGDINARASLHEKKKEGIVELLVTYKGGKEILIPAGTLFQGEYNLFELRFDEHLPAQATVRVPIVPLTELDKSGEDFLPYNASLILLDAGTMKNCNVSKVRVIDDYEEREDLEHRTRPAFTVSKDNKKGCILVDCDFGTKIPAGTRFLYQDADGKDYLFESVTEAGELIAQKNIYVNIKDMEHAVIIKYASEEDPQNIWEETGKINKMLQNIEGILTVENKKRAGIMLGEEEDKDGSARLTIRYRSDRNFTLKAGTRFYNYTARKGIYNMFVLPQSITLKACGGDKNCSVKVRALTDMPAAVKKNKALQTGTQFYLESENKISGVMSARVGNKDKPFQFKGGKGRDKAIIVKLKYGTIVPEGTCFYCIQDGEKLQYITTEAVGYTYGEAVGIRVECEGQNFKRRSNTGDLVYAEADTIHAMDPEDEREEILFITNPKAALKKENPPKIATAKEFFDFLYSRKDNLARDTIRAEIEGKIDLDMELLREPWFLDTYLTGGEYEEFDRLSSRKKRAVILTLIFLKYRKEMSRRTEWDFAENWTESVQKELDSFGRNVDYYMGQCRMNGFDLGNPLDAFFALLLLDEDSCDTLRLLYKMLIA